MPNQTLIVVPSNIDTPEVLRRFLQQVVEQLDIISGFRGSLEYSTAAELERLASQVTTALAELEASQLSLDETIAKLKEDTQFSLDDITAVINAAIARQSELNWLKGFHVEFIGRSTNGAVTMSANYNIASGTRDSIGLYTFTLTQDTIEGNNILDKLAPSISWEIDAASDAFSVTYSKVSTSSFTLEVRKLAVSGAAVVANLYDPDTAGDRVTCAGLFSIEGDLPST